MLKEETIKELQNIIKEQYGKEVSFSEASRIGNGLVNHFNLLAKLNYKIENE